MAASPSRGTLAGRSFEQNGDGVIANREGNSATAPRTLQLNADAQIQTVADLTQLLRVLQAGVDGDGAADLDGSRIYYQGYGTRAQLQLLRPSETEERGVVVVACWDTYRQVLLSAAHRHSTDASGGAARECS